MGQVRRRWYLFRPKACHFKFKLRYTCTLAGFCRRKRQDTPDVIHPLVDQPKQRLRGRMRQDTVKSGEIVQLKPALRVYIGCPRYRVHRQRLNQPRPLQTGSSLNIFRFARWGLHFGVEARMPWWDAISKYRTLEFIRISRAAHRWLSMRSDQDVVYAIPLEQV